MKRTNLTYLLPKPVLSILAFHFLFSPVEGQSTSNAVNSNVVGYNKAGAYSSSNTYLGLLSNSDTLVSVPFTRPPEFGGTIQTVAGNVVTVTGLPGWSTNQFVYAKGTQPKTYYALVGPGPSGVTNPKEGCIYQVAANTSNSLTLDLNGDVITSIPATSTITLIPYWTLGTLFPASNANVSFTATTSTSSLQTEILIPNYAGTGINLSTSETYYFINSGTNVGWRLYGDATTTDHSDDILDPEGYFVVRNPASGPTLPLIATGGVLSGNVTTPEATLATRAQDNDVAMIRPIGVSLNNTGLSPTNGSFVATSSTRSLQDQLLIYNNAQVAQNKSASATYYYIKSGTNVGWRLLGDATTTDHGADIIPAGSALTIRKAASTSGATAFWQNGPTY